MNVRCDPVQGSNGETPFDPSDTIAVELHMDLVFLAALARKERVRLGITDDLSIDRIPGEGAVQSHCDVGQVAYL